MLTKYLCLYMLCDKVFCSHLPSIAWELKVARRRKNYLNKRKDFVGITSFCEATGLPVLLSTLKKFSLFSPGWKLPIMPTLIRLPFIVPLPLRWWRRTFWRTISPSSSRVNLVIVLLVTFKLLLRILSSLLRWKDWLMSLCTFNMYINRASLHGHQVVVLSDHVLLLCSVRFSNSFAVVSFLEVLLHKKRLPGRVRGTLWFSPSVQPLAESDFW